MTHRFEAKKVRFGRRPGCLVAVLLVGAGLGFGGFIALGPVREAKRLEQDLIDRYATVPEFVPAADGAIAPERMEIFLAVRKALLSRTSDVQDTYARIDHAMAQEDLSTAEGVSTVKDAFNALPRMVEFYQARNGELLDRGMGLGEYFYIYIAAYGDRLCPPSVAGEAAGKCRFVTARTTRELTQILRNQLANLDAAPGPETTAILKREIAALKRGDIAVPWQEGLPAAVSASLVPYRERLQPLFCLATRELELGQKNKHVGGIAE